MRTVIRLLFLVVFTGLLSSCESGPGGQSPTTNALVHQAGLVKVRDGITSSDATTLASAYLHRYVADRGSTFPPVDQGKQWAVATTSNEGDRLIFVNKVTGNVSMLHGPTVEPDDF